MTLHQQRLPKSLTEPCPVCDMVAVAGMAEEGAPLEPPEGAVLICYGCGLLQVVHEGLAVPPSVQQADWLYQQPEVIARLLAVSHMRALNPHRVKEFREDQK